MAKKRRKRRGSDRPDGRALGIGLTILILLLAGGLILINVISRNEDPRAVEPEMQSSDASEATGILGDEEEGDSLDEADEEYALTIDGGNDEDLSDPEASMLPVVSRAKNAGNKIALTMDDCNEGQNVLKMLDIADQYGFKMTFFPIGKAVEKNPDVFREVYERGHEIENHSYSHKNMTELSDDEAIKEIVRQNEAVNKALNLTYEMHIFRPPSGAGMKSEKLHGILANLNYEALASWGISGTQDPDKVLKNMRSGDIILFHAKDKDISRLEYFIPEAIERGFEFVTINELYNKEPNRAIEN